MAKIFPSLRYDDPVAAIHWLCKVFGFTRVCVIEHEGKVAHAELAYGDAVVMLGSGQYSYILIIICINYIYRYTVDSIIINQCLYLLVTKWFTHRLII